MRYSVFAQKIIDRFSVYFCDTLQLDHVQSTFSEFAFRDEGMWFAKSFGDLFLKVTGIVPRFY